jgi:Protein of unknown function (DUF2865)
MLFSRFLRPMPLAVCAVCAVCAITPLALVRSPSTPAPSPPVPQPSDNVAQSDNAAKPSDAVAVTGHMIPQKDWPDWSSLGSIFGFSAPPPPPRLERREKPPPRKATPPPATYRTMCVRTCDGFYWPISYSVPHGRAKRDAQQCEKSCPGKARLFLYRNPGQEIEDMVDLEGRRYSDSPKAFLYRTEYVADCTCRGHPWEEEAMARHRSYINAVKAKTSAAAR